jgi:NADPH:quinone reductase
LTDTPPRSARRLTCRRLGTPPELAVEGFDVPAPGPGRCTLEVEASNVAYVDALLVRGGYQLTPSPPFTPGTTVVGRVVATGPEVDPDLRGRRVAGLSLDLGAFASHTQVPAWAVRPVPDGPAPPRIAVTLEAYGTARFALEHRGGLRPGETVIVLGAGGAVGRAVVDTAHLLGARVVAVSGSEERRRAALDLGADLAVDAHQEDLRGALREAVPEGADVVVDPVGGTASEAGLRTLGEGGRHLVVGFAGGTIPHLPANHVLLRNRNVVGVEWGGWIRTHPASLGPDLDVVLGRLAEDLITPLVPVRIGLDGLAERLGADGEPRGLGALVLTPSTDDPTGA